MKIITREAVIERSKLVCDKCGKEAVSSLNFSFGYGSDYDLQEMVGDFCNKHGSELMREILKYKIKLKPIKNDSWK